MFVLYTLDILNWKQTISICWGLNNLMTQHDLSLELFMVFSSSIMVNYRNSTYQVHTACRSIPARTHTRCPHSALVGSTEEGSWLPASSALRSSLSRSGTCQHHTGHGHRSRCCCCTHELLFSSKNKVHRITSVSFGRSGDCEKSRVGLFSTFRLVCSSRRQETKESVECMNYL